MNKNTIDPAVIAKHRATLETWNLIGKRIFTVTAEPADLNYNDQVRDGDPYRTVKPIMKYMIEAIDIIKVGLKTAPDDVTVLIELNENPKYQFKIGPASFREVTMEAIKESISATNTDLGREPVLFTNCLQLTEQVNKLNAMEVAKANKIAEAMLGVSSVLESLNKNQRNDCDKYYDELGTPLRK